MILENRTFRLAAGVAEEEFTRTDADCQTQFVYRQRGLIRRTTARGFDGSWLVATLWDSLDDAEAAERAEADDAVGARWLALVDRDSMETRRFEALPG